MRERLIIDAFPKPGWIDTISCDGKPCSSSGDGCAGSPTASGSNGNCRSNACGDSSSCDLEATLKNFARKHSDLVELKIADYSSLGAILESLENLNRVLEANSEDLRVSIENLALVFSQLAPIIAINNKLAFVGKAPNEAQLLDAIALHQAHLT